MEHAFSYRNIILSDAQIPRLLYIVLISTFLNSDLGTRAGCEERGVSSEFPVTFLGGVGGRGSGAGSWQNVKEDKV